MPNIARLGARQGPYRARRGLFSKDHGLDHQQKHDCYAGMHTCVAHHDPVVHHIAEHGHDDTKKGEEDPVFSDLGKGVSPDE